MELVPWERHRAPQLPSRSTFFRPLSSCRPPPLAASGFKSWTRFLWLSLVPISAASREPEVALGLGQVHLAPAPITVLPTLVEQVVKLNK